MQILSLFDGMSCGQIALNRLGLKPSKYYAAEIDKYAISVTMANYPETIQLGDATKWQSWDLTDGIEWDKIDLVIGGSPCQGFSMAGKQLNFEDPRSRLFFTFVDIVEHVLEHNPKVKFLLENVKMKKEHEAVISDYMLCNPIEINSALVSAQNRRRLYWTNIKGVDQPEDKGIRLKDILEPEVSGIYDCTKQFFSKNKGTLAHKKAYANCRYLDEKSKCLTTGGQNISNSEATNVIKVDKKGNIKQNQNKSSCLTGGGNSGGNHSDMDLLIIDYGVRRLTPIECERLQTVPDNYTNQVSNTQRYKMLGNGWTVDVIAHIFKNLLHD